MIFAAHHRWLSIQQLKQVVADRKRVAFTGKRLYRSKIKLHGTYAGIRVDQNGIVTTQSRNVVDPPDGNFGFATWVKGHTDYFENFCWISNGSTVIIHGEWAGPGIQSGTAIQHIPTKTFFVFALQIANAYITDPTLIESLGIFMNVPAPDEYVILPWFADGIGFTINFLEGYEEISSGLLEFSEAVFEINKMCPFTLEKYTVEGPGEGLVFYPGENAVYRSTFETFAFKMTGNFKKIRLEATAEAKPPTSGDREELVAFVKEKIDISALKVIITERKLSPSLSSMPALMRILVTRLSPEAVVKGFEQKDFSRVLGHHVRNLLKDEYHAT